MSLAKQTTGNRSIVSFPISARSIFRILTFFPSVYTYVPLLGQMRMVLVSGIVLLISYMLTANSYKNVSAWKNSTIIALVGYFFAITLSMATSLDRGSSLKIIEMNLKYLLVILIMAKIIDDEKRQDFNLAVFISCGVGMAIISIVNYGVYGKTFVQGGIISNRSIAVESGLFGDPNDLAMLFNVSLPFMLYYYFKSKHKTIPTLSIIITVIAIVLTHSRGGFLGFCAVTLGFLILKGKTRARYVLLVMIVASLVWLLAPESYKDRILTIGKEAQVDDELGEYPGRLQAWIELAPRGLENPILGVGAGCSIYVAGTARNDWVSIHNSFLQVFIELGLMGIIFYVCTYISQYMQYRHYRHKYGKVNEKYVERFNYTLLSLLAYAVTAFFLPQAYSPIFYYISGVSVINAELCNASKRQ